MRTVNLVLLAGIVVLGLCGSDAWGQRFGRRENPNAVDVIPSPFSGTVVSITGSSVTLKGVVHKPKSPGVIQNPNESQSHERSVSFPIHPDTKILRDGKTIPATEIAKGEQCTVSFTSKPGSSLRHVTDVQVGKVTTAKDKGDAADPPKKSKKKQT